MLIIEVLTVSSCGAMAWKGSNRSSLWRGKTNGTRIGSYRRRRIPVAAFRGLHSNTNKGPASRSSCWPPATQRIHPPAGVFSLSHSHLLLHHVYSCSSFLFFYHSRVYSYLSTTGIRCVCLAQPHVVYWYATTSGCLNHVECLKILVIYIYIIF